MKYADNILLIYIKFLLIEYNFLGYNNHIADLYLFSYQNAEKWAVLSNYLLKFTEYSLLLVKCGLQFAL